MGIEFAGKGSRNFEGVLSILADQFSMKTTKSGLLVQAARGVTSALTRSPSVSLAVARS